MTVLATAAALTPPSGCLHTLFHLVCHQEWRAGGLLRGHEGPGGGGGPLTEHPAPLNELGFLLSAFLLMEFSSQN